MTPQTIKKHIKIADQIISGEINNARKIRLLYEESLCNEAVLYINKETKTKKLSTLLKKLKIKKQSIELDNFIVSQTKKTGVFDKDLIASTYVPLFLEVSKYEYQKIVKAEKILPAGYSSVRMYGRSVSVPYFDIEDLANYYIKNKNNGELNKLHLKKEFKDFKIDFKNNSISSNFILTSRISANLKEFFDYDINIDNLRENIKKSIIKVKNKKEEIINSKATDCANFILLSGVNVYINKKQDKLQLIDKSEKLKKIDFNKKIKLSFNQLLSFSNLDDEIKELNLSDLPQNKLDDIINLYPAIKNKKRKITFILGDTNSGKTHEAMDYIKTSKSGIYLAPLRILAQEKYEELKNNNINVALITGEEKKIPDGYTHISSTIETLDPDKYYETGIIDEIQMIDDHERGMYWLKAILALNANSVFVIGSKDFIYKNMLFSLLEKYNIPYEIKIKERISKLTKLKAPVNSKDLKSGDLIVAFDKNTLFNLACKIKDSGKSVSVLFGDLNYNRKIEEINKFKSGKSQILIATDAVAMGINMPIKRVLFYKCYKYNGDFNTPIDITLFKQIIGRAGRYKADGEFGLYVSKEVNAVLHENDEIFLKSKNANIFKSLSEQFEINKNNTFEIKKENNLYYFNDYVDDYLLSKISKNYNLNYYATISLYNSKNNIFRNIECDICIYPSIIDISSDRVLFKIMSLSPKDRLFEYKTINDYINKFVPNKQTLFTDEKITQYLNIDFINESLKDMLAENSMYTSNWNLYARDLSYNERYGYF